MNYFWRVLGIDPTTDLRKIKQAYAQLSRQYHPEEFPEEFRRIQEAYKDAMAWRKRQVELESQAEQSISNQVKITSPLNPSQPDLEAIELAETEKKSGDTEAYTDIELGELQGESNKFEGYTDIELKALRGETKKIDTNEAIDITLEKQQSESDKEEQLDSIILSDDENSSEQSKVSRNQTIFQLGIEDTYEKIQAFLNKIMPFLEGGVDLSLFRKLLAMAQAEHLLGDLDFNEAFSDLLVIHLRENKIKLEDLNSLLILARANKLTPFIQYLEELDFQRKGRGALMKEESHQLNWKYFRFVCLIFTLLAFSLMLTLRINSSNSSSHKRYQSDPSSSSKTYSYSYNNDMQSSDIQKVIEAAKEVSKTVPKSISDSVLVTYDEATATFYIENSATGNKQAIPNAKDVMILDTEENGERKKAIVMTTDDKIWQLLSDDGQIRGTVTGSDQLTSSSVLTITDGQITVKTAN